LRPGQHHDHGVGHRHPRGRRAPGRRQLMALPPLATDSDLETWLGHPVDVPRALAILNASSTLIRNHTGRVWVDEDEVTEDGVTALQLEGVRLVCKTLAARVYDNPQGKTQRAAGPFSSSVAAWYAY